MERRSLKDKLQGKRAWLLQRDAQREWLRWHPEQRDALAKDGGEGPPQAGAGKRRYSTCGA